MYGEAVDLEETAASETTGQLPIVGRQTEDRVVICREGEGFGEGS